MFWLKSFLVLFFVSLRFVLYDVILVSFSISLIVLSLFSYDDDGDDCQW